MPVRFGIAIQHRPELLGPVATRAEALGFDSVWIGDHVAIHRPTLDSMAALSYVAALTRRVRIGPCVYLARKYCLLGPPAACVERLAEFEAAGVRSFVIYFTVPGERVLEQLERFAAEIMPRVPGVGG